MLRVVCAAAVSVVCMASARPASAQNTFTLVTGATYTFSIPKVAEYVAGFTVPVVMKININVSGSPATVRHESVQFQCVTTVGGSPCGDYQVSQGASGIWTDLTATFATSGVAYDITKNGTGDPTNDQFLLRKKLSWVNDVPGSYGVTVNARISVWSP